MLQVSGCAGRRSILCVSARDRHGRRNRISGSSLRLNTRPTIFTVPLELLRRHRRAMWPKWAVRVAARRRLHHIRRSPIVVVR